MYWYNRLNQGSNSLACRNLASHKLQRNAKIYVATPRNCLPCEREIIQLNIFRFLYLGCPFHLLQLYTFVECTNVEPKLNSNYKQVGAVCLKAGLLR